MLETLGGGIKGVRLDTTGSRQGDMRAIIDDVRWRLQQADREDVDILVSGGIDTGEVWRLRDVADGFGVGT